MSWTVVKWIFFREVRDQLRDRRTLFMIFVLPIMLYPLLGMSFFQVVQFVREHPTRVLLVGVERLPDHPRLLIDGQFDPALFDSPRRARLLEVVLADKATSSEIERHPQVAVRRVIDSNEVQIVVHFPSNFDHQLKKYREALKEEQRRAAEGEDLLPPKVPSPAIYQNSALEKSQIAYARVVDVLNRWQERIAGEILSDVGLPASAPKPFTMERFDVAQEGRRDAAVWSKIFPFLLLIWALTGAFYPAVDLCAGEKERGTLETLLCSPAERGEIVFGKLLTVMLFSVATVVFNLASMAVTGMLIMSQIPQLGPPPLGATLWLIPALIPVSALFSALCLALAAFARSNKEGQYYLMPLILVTMPLVVLPMAPGTELNLGVSLIPVTGIVLLLRTLLEGNLWQALPYLPPVTIVTLACCWLAVRWAIDQFNSETVLFREGERVGLTAWVRHLMRDRGDTPSVAMALFCGMLILLIRFFMSFALPQPASFDDFAVLALVSSLVVIATPALLMTVMLTTNYRKTLLLRRPRWQTIPAAVGLAIMLHPLTILMQHLVVTLYPVNEEALAEVQRLIGGSANLWMLLLVMAVVPAICEELAFRGFILSGFRHLGHKWRAIVLTSLLFGMSHAIFQQSVLAFFMGLIIGYLAVQTASVFPCMVFHICHNGLALAISRLDASWAENSPLGRWLLVDNEGALTYHWQVAALGAVGVIALLTWFHRLPYPKSDEESLQERIDHPTAGAVAGLRAR